MSIRAALRGGRERLLAPEISTRAWILIEAAWNCRFAPRPSKAIAARRQKVAPGVKAIAEKAEVRLYRRFTRLTNRGKNSRAAVTAVARELVGFVWAIAREEQLLAA